MDLAVLSCVVSVLFDNVYCVCRQVSGQYYSIYSQQSTWLIIIIQVCCLSARLDALLAAVYKMLQLHVCLHALH